LDISGKFCPVCKKKNAFEAAVCMYCGASLEVLSTDSATTKGTELPTDGTEKAGEEVFDEAAIPVDGIAFYVDGISEPVFSNSKKEFIMGRKVEETSGELFDLSKIGGYHLGVSRRHALIRRTSSGYEVMDLSSSNGTWLNDERLIPNKAYPLARGSQLRLARVRLFVLYRSVTETEQKI
jgi:FHA domain